MLKNERVRVEMVKLGITQTKLGEILGKDTPTINRLLNEVEWSRREQDDAIKKMRETASA
jgi:plasmid maintenance system antidote protein VapI